MTAKCPECRASFDLVVPDLTYLPEKYHKFVTNNVRRVYVDFSSANKELRESLTAAEDRLARKAAMEQTLLRRCEELAEALSIHRQGERDANMRILELQEDNAFMEKRLREKGHSAKEVQRMHGLILDKVKCLEKTNQVLQQENVRLSLRYHDTGKTFDKECIGSIVADTLSNQTTDVSSSQSPNTSSVVLRPKHKQRKHVVHSTSEDTSVAVPMSRSTTNSSVRSASTSRPVRPIKPLPKRRSIRNRVLGDSSFMSIDPSDFV